MKLLWRLKSGDIDEAIFAKDQFAAFDSLRHRSKSDFGLVVIATPDGGGEDDSIPIRTSLLMRRWCRDVDAKEFVRRGCEEGMPDTNEADLVSAGRK